MPFPSFSSCAPPTFPLEGGLDGFPLRVSNEGLLRPRVARAQEPQEADPSFLVIFPHFAPNGEWPRWPFTARIERPSFFQMILPSLLAFSSREGDLFGLPLRASNEHLPSVRVARAQEANRPPSHSFSPLTEAPHSWL